MRPFLFCALLTASHALALGTDWVQFCGKYLKREHVALSQSYERWIPDDIADELRRLNRAIRSLERDMLLRSSGTSASERQWRENAYRLREQLVESQTALETLSWQVVATRVRHAKPSSAKRDLIAKTQRRWLPAIDALRAEVSLLEEKIAERELRLLLPLSGTANPAKERALLDKKRERVEELRTLIERREAILEELER